MQSKSAIIGAISTRVTTLTAVATRNSWRWLLAICLASSLVGCGDSAIEGKDAPVRLVAHDARMPARPPSQRVAAVYLQLQNPTDSDCVVSGAAADISPRVEIHQHSHDHATGMMQMRQVVSVLIGSGETVDFTPGGYHLMLFDLAAMPEVGDSFWLQLQAGDCGLLETTVRVTPNN